MRKNVLVHSCGMDTGSERQCYCRSYITGAAAAAMVAEGMARYRLKASGPGMARTDLRTIVLVKQYPKHARGVTAKDIVFAYGFSDADGNAGERRRIELFGARMQASCTYRLETICALSLLRTGRLASNKRR